MARLPVPGADNGQWGAILNAFLEVAHNADGTPKDTGVIQAKYVKPSGGIPEDDLDVDVQAKLNSGGSSPATSGSLGVIQLAGDLSGTATAPTIAAGAITASKIANTTITNAQIAAGAAIDQSKLNLSLTKSDVGLANVDNTSDANKPVSSATQTALNAKEATITAGTTGQYWRGDKSWQTLDKTAVGLANVDNTTDANKPVSTATQSALDLKANLASPTFTGTVTLPATTLAGNIDMNGSQVTDLGTTTNPTDAATKSYVDGLTAASTPITGGVGLRDPHLEAWYEDLANATTQPVDLVVIGDSITEFGWADALEEQLTTRYNARAGVTTQPVIGYHSNFSGSATAYHTMQTPGGTPVQNGLAGYSSTMSNGQSASMDVYCDGVFVIWTAGTGILTVKDGGSGGSTVATIDTSTGSGASNITSVNLTTYAKHNIWIGSTGNTHLEGIYPTVGNRTVGLRVWRAAHTGYKTVQFANDTTLVLDFIAKLKAHTGREPHVLIATGFNDSLTDVGEGTYEEVLNDLINAVKARTNGTITRWINWGSVDLGGGGVAKHDIALQVAEEQGLAVIDAFRAFGDVGDRADANELSGDQAHPNAASTPAIMQHALAVMSGDPIGMLSGINASYPGLYRGAFNTTHSIPAGNALWSPTLDFGSVESGHFFGLPLFQVKNSQNDDWGQVSIVPGPLIEQIQPTFDASALAFGPGGDGAFSPTWDAFLYRSGTNELSLRASGTAYANLVTNLNRHGSNSPEGVVSAPVGATYRDTTNGTNYTKTTGTGNTGWAYASGVQPINAQTGTSYTLVLADQFKLVTLSNASAITLTVPTNTSVAFPVGARIDFIQGAAGQVTFAGADGTVTINATPGLKISGQYAAASLIKTATNTWHLIGSLSA